MALLVKDMTDKEAKAFYNSKAWKQKRIEILKRDHFECQDCIKRARSCEEIKGVALHIRRATEVHHIMEYKEKPDLGLDDNNLISLCTQCHNLRHGRGPREFQPMKKRATEEKW